MQILTANQLAKELQLSVRTIQKLTKKRILPSIRLSGRCRRYDYEAVQKALKRFHVDAIKDD